MTKKDYQKGAELIKARTQAMIRRNLLDLEDIVLAHKHMTALMVEFFQSDNPNFEEGKFLEACKCAESWTDVAQEIMDES